MPRMNQDKYSDEDIGNYELDYSDDPRPIIDLELESQADKSGIIHARKNAGKTEYLPGYGISDFGVSSYEPKAKFTGGNMLLASGLVTAGLVTWKFRDTITTGLMSLFDYALILRESRSEQMTDQP